LCSLLLLATQVFMSLLWSNNWANLKDYIWNSPTANLLSRLLPKKGRVVVKRLARIRVGNAIISPLEKCNYC